MAIYGFASPLHHQKEHFHSKILKQIQTGQNRDCFKKSWQNKHCQEAIKTVIGNLSLNYCDMSLMEYVISVT